MILSGFYFMGAYHSIKVVSSADELPTNSQPIGSTKGFNLYDTSEWGQRFYAIKK